MSARLSLPHPSPSRRARATPRPALALLAVLLAGGLTTAAVEAAEGEHFALDGSFALPSAPTQFSRDWSAGPGFGIGWVVPASSTRDWALRIGGNSFAYAPRSDVEAKVSLLSFTLAHRAILRRNALGPYVRVAAGAARVLWQRVITGPNSWRSDGTAGWAGCVEVGGGISPPIPEAAVRPFVDASWVAAFTGEKLGKVPLHTVTARLGIEFVPAGFEEQGIEEPEAKTATGVVAPDTEAAAPAPSDSGASRAPAAGAHSRGPATQRTRLVVGGGLALPAGSKGAPDYWGAGLGLEVGAEFRIVRRAAFLVTCAEDRLGFDEDRFRKATGFPPTSEVFGESADIGLYLVGVRVQPWSRGGWDSYADALVGRAAFSTEYSGAYSTTGESAFLLYRGTESGFAWAVGLGARRASPGRLGWFAEAHWVSLQVFEGTWSYAPLRAGVIWR